MNACGDSMLCIACKIVKPVSDFSRNPNGKPGYRKKCKQCRVSDERKRYASNPRRHIEYCNEWRHKTGRCSPALSAKGTPVYQGYIAELLLQDFFDGLEAMQNCNPGYDYVCSKGFKIDVKSACLRYPDGIKSGRWEFCIKKNRIADYFLCLAFDNISSLNPLHVWLFPGDVLNGKAVFRISNINNSLKKWSAFEKSLDSVKIRCIDLKTEGVL